jgi:peptidoglycan hydrolase-like protein with peptidoglycan-binding domain
MRKIFLVTVVFAFGICVFGCGKKQVEEQQEPMSMEALSNLNTSATPVAGAISPSTQTAPVDALAPKGLVAKPVVPPAQPVMQPAAKLEPLPPGGPYKPTGIEIQTALKNAGFYTGTIDGKFGVMSKNAIEAFQKANNLQADGKVGPKTWAALSKYLKAAAAPLKKKR